MTGFAFDADGDLWLTVVTPSGGTLCRARHDSWGTSVEQVVTQIDGAPLGVLSAVETGPDGKVYFAVSTEAAAKNGLESALRTELIAHTGTGCVYVYDRRPGRWNRCWAAWPVRLVWPSRRMAERCTFPTSGIAASGLWTPTPGN